MYERAIECLELLAQVVHEANEKACEGAEAARHGAVAREYRKAAEALRNLEKREGNE